MILEYNYDKANKILSYMRESQLASLKVQKYNNDSYIMEYTLVSEYSESMQKKIRKVMSDALPQRLGLISIFNRFIENMITNSVTTFRLDYNAVSVKKCQINYECSYSSVKNQEKPSFADAPIKIKQCLEQIDKCLMEMGIQEVAIPELYEKTKGNSGKRKNYTPVHAADAITYLRKTLTDAGN